MTGRLCLPPSYSQVKQTGVFIGPESGVELPARPVAIPSSGPKACLRSALNPAARLDSPEPPATSIKRGRCLHGSLEPELPQRRYWDPLGCLEIVTQARFRRVSGAVPIGPGKLTQSRR